MARRVLTIVLILALALVALIVAPIEFAAAQRGAPAPAPQQPGALGGFFNFLFGAPRPAPRVLPPQQPRARSAPLQSSSASPPVAAAAPPVAKDPMARKVVVIGDFVAGVVAAGLDQGFAAEPKIRVIDRSNADSSFARPDYYDWSHVLPDILAADHPDVVVAVFGSNDRQQLSGSSTAQWGTQEWDATYSNRVTALAAMLSAYGAPFFWVGTLPMRSTPEPDMAHLNDLIEPRVAAAGGHFIDVWDGFADDNGHLVITGPDVNGQTVALRSGNGINFTDAGQAKLAFYVEREIQKQTGIDTGNVDLQASLSQTSRIEIGPDGTRRLVGPVISLTDPAPSASATLLGDPAASPPGNASFQPLLAAPKDGQSPQALLIDGAALPVVPGRADDFTWPRPPGTAALPPSAGAVAAASPAKSPAAVVTAGQ
jgi:hypothetical protein